MYVILYSWMKVITTKDEITLKNMFNNENVSFMLKKQIRMDLLSEMLNDGLIVNTPSDIDSDEKRVMIHLEKSYPNCFHMSEKEADIRRMRNVRGIIQTCIETGTEPEILQHYANIIEEEEILYIGDHFTEALSLLSSEGLTKVKWIRADEQAGVVIKKCPPPIVLLEKEAAGDVSILKGVKYVLFSLNDLQIGPILLKGKTSCMQCALLACKRNDGISYKPAWFRKFVLTFIAEIVYYLGGNLYEEIYHDVGLPLNKVYIINVPQSSICTFALYKNVNCGGCLDNE